MGQAAQADRCMELRRAIAVLPIRITVQRLQCSHDGRRIELASGQIEHALARIQNGPVARAAAQVARQRIGQLLPGGSLAALRLLLFVDRPQGHHKTRCAKAALGSVALHHGLLHGMQIGAARIGLCRLAGGFHVFHGEQRLAMQIGQQLDAGVHGLQLQALHRLRVAGFGQFGHQHGAGAAIAFIAALLGAMAMGIFAQPVQHGTGRRRAIDLRDAALVIKTDRLGYGRLAHGGYCHARLGTRLQISYQRSVPRRPAHNNPAISAIAQPI
ncbi:hypothetical protein D3C72_1143620 [compost metagenome]